MVKGVGHRVYVKKKLNSDCLVCGIVVVYGLKYILCHTFKILYIAGINI